MPVDENIRKAAEEAFKNSSPDLPIDGFEIGPFTWFLAGFVKGVESQKSAQAIEKRALSR